MEKIYSKVSFEVSQLFTKTYSTSFFISTRILPPEMRKAIFSIYGFVRLADEIVDSFFSCNQERLLNEFENSLLTALDEGLSTNPVLQSFVVTIKKYQIPYHHIDSFLKSMQADLSKNKYQTTKETDEYIHGSAKVVGLMCLKVFVNGCDKKHKELEVPAMKLGAAFQKVNFLRDLKQDTEILKRIYFPKLVEQNLSETIKQELIADIEKDFVEAKKGICLLPKEAKVAVTLAYAYYMQLLKKIKRLPAKEITQKRIRVSNFVKLMLLVKVSIVAKFGRF
jgi:phytoene synthase